MERIIIYGNSSTAEVVAEYIDAVDGLKVAAFTINKEFITETIFANKRLVPFEGLNDTYPPDRFKLLIMNILGAEYPRIGKMEKSEEAKKMGYRLFTFIDPSVYIAKTAKIGENCVILNRSIVEPFASVGNGTVLRSGSFISHHCQVGEYCYLSPCATLAGNVEIGSFCFLGVNCTIHNNKKIGAHSIIGGGAVVNKNVQEYGVIKAASGKLLDESSKKFHI